MKTNALLLTAILLLTIPVYSQNTRIKDADFYSASGQEQWEIVNQGIGTSPFHSFGGFIDANHFWSNSTEGNYKTIDGGNTWFPDAATDKYGIRIVDFITDSIGWGVTDSSWMDLGSGIYKTTDGGMTWSRKLGVGSNSFVEYIHAVDDSTAYVFGGNNLFKTIDGGTKWVDVTPPEIYNFIDGCFSNADTGVLIGNDEYVTVIFRTFNGGESWEVKTSIDYDICSMRDIEFLNDSTGYFLARAHEPSTSWNHFLYKSTDSFNSWSVVTDERYSILAYHFFDEDEAISVMEDDLNTTWIMKSGDGGLSWEKSGVNALPSGWDYQLVFIDNVGYLFGSSKMFCSSGGYIIMKTVDQGFNWEILSFSYPFRDVFCKNETEVYFTGGSLSWGCGDGNLIRSDDGFKTFNFLPGMGGGKTCQFIGDYVGYYIGDYVDYYSGGELYKTSDGDDGWIRDAALCFVDDICFINESVGFAIASKDWQNAAGICKTTNGGEKWDTFYSTEGDEELISIFFMEENTGWSIGWTGERCYGSVPCDGRPTMNKYDIAQGWRKIPLEIVLPLNKINFFNIETGWITGGYNNQYGNYFPLLLRSEDGGENWSEVAGLNYLINDFYFATIDHGWAVGEDSIGRGVILETFNSGMNWEVVVDSLSRRLNAIHFLDGHGWAVGDNGLILEMYDTTYVTGIERSETFTNSEGLLHLYPNPVYSVLNIETGLPNHYFIEIASLNGQLMFSEQIEGPTHQLDLSSFRSGIYFITLRSKDLIRTKKFIKL